MLTAVLQSPRHFNIVERSQPVPDPGEVIVRTGATAVCHTDLSLYTGHHPGVRYPIVLGHESTGTIAAIGEGVTGLEVGQNVIINPIMSCGHCDCCARGDGHLCRNAGIFGREYEGSLSQLMRVPARNVFKLPPELPLDEATLIETLATVRHAQTRAGIKAGESVAVLGQGTAGLLNTRLAVLDGAASVIAVSRTRFKLEMAMKMGAQHAVRASVADAVDEVVRLTGGKGVDVVIDTAGGAETLKAGIDMLRPGGRFCSFSLGHEPFTKVTAFLLYFKEMNVIGARALTELDMAPSIELVASGKIDVKGFISSTYPLRQTAAAFEEYEGNPSRILRIVIDSRAA